MLARLTREPWATPHHSRSWHNVAAFSLSRTLYRRLGTLCFQRRPPGWRQPAGTKLTRLHNYIGSNKHRPVDVSMDNVLPCLFDSFVVILYIEFIVPFVSVNLFSIYLPSLLIHSPIFLRPRCAFTHNQLCVLKIFFSPECWQKRQNS